MLNSPLKIFIAFAKEDKDVRDKLLRQMNLVKTREGWDIWASHEIKAGAIWNEEIKTRLAESEVVVLLMSSSFFNSKYILETELPAIVEKHRVGNCHIVPVLARHCLWKDTSFGDYAALGDLQALPAGEKPIVSKGNWDSEEEPFMETVQGLKMAIQGFKYKKAERLAQIARQQLEDEDHAAFQNAVTVASLENYLRQDFTIHAAEARKKLAELQLAEQARLTIEETQKKPQEEAERPKNENWEPNAQKQKDSKAKKPFPVRLIAISVGGVLGFILIWVLWLWLGLQSKGEKINDNLGQNQTQPIIKPSSDTSGAVKKTASEKEVMDQDKPKSTFKDPFEGQMVKVEGGTFLMGGFNKVKTGLTHVVNCQYSAKINTFFISKFEVTNQQWEEVTRSHIITKKPQCHNCPKGGISYEDIQNFIKNLNAQTNKKYRLPTEEEWEYAAKGGGNNNNQYYSGSDSYAKVAWCLNNANKSMPVGQKTPNKLGLFDMSGNICEWTSSPCQQAHLNCKTYSGVQNKLVLRGGSWDDSELNCGTISRDCVLPTSRKTNYGFRLAHD